MSVPLRPAPALLTAGTFVRTGPRFPFRRGLPAADAALALDFGLPFGLALVFLDISASLIAKTHSFAMIASVIFVVVAAPLAIASGPPASFIMS